MFSPGLALLGSDEGIWVVGWSHETAVSQMGEGGDEWRARNEAKGKQRKITREEKRREEKRFIGWLVGRRVANASLRLRFRRLPPSY